MTLPAGPERAPGFRLLESALLIVISVLLLVPCFWQERIVAGDLSSHAYNAWLVGEIRQGRAPGLEIVPVWTNVLTDLGLEALSGVVGMNLATQLVAASAVLVFFWGAFFLLNTTSGQRPWVLCPLLGILTYGVVFQFGFLNFYLSVGLCLWIIGLLWHPTRWKVLCAAPLVSLAIVAHAFPVAWAAAMLGYLHVFRRLSVTLRLIMPILSLVALMVVQQGLMAQFPSRWSWGQLALAGFFGADQAWIYDDKYLVVAGGLLFCMIVIFLQCIDHLDFVSEPGLQMWILHVAGSVLFPAAIQLPQYQHPLAYIPLRISLLTAIAFCIMAGEARPGRGITRLSGIVAVAFFSFLYVDTFALNQVETEITRIIRQAPESARVVAFVIDEGTRLNGLAHAADRACIGHCFSYANYEPATAQFRSRVKAEGGAAAPTMAAVDEMGRGEHTVTPAEAPLYAVCPCEDETGAFCLRRLNAGERTCASTRVITVRLLDGVRKWSWPF